MGTGSKLSRRAFPSPSSICVSWEGWKEGKSNPSPMRFDIYPYCTVSLAFCWCQFELLVEGYVGLTSPFSGIRHNVGLTSLFSGIWHNDLAEARAQATSTQSPANQPMRPLHHHPNLKTCFNHLMRICRCSSEKFSRVKPSQGTHLNSIKKRKIGKKIKFRGKQFISK